MLFDITEIKVNEGKKIRLTLRHTGSMTKASMGHNFVLLTLGTDIGEFEKAVIADGKAPNFEVPESLLKSVIAHTEMIGGGENATVEFIAPEKGTYDFICSFPGHSGIMQGKFIVE